MARAPVRPVAGGRWTRTSDEVGLGRTRRRAGEERDVDGRSTCRAAGSSDIASRRPATRRRLRPVRPPASAASPPLGPRRRRASPSREYDLPAIPTLPAPLAGRGDDRPGGRRHQRRDARPVRQHRRRRRRRSIPTPRSSPTSPHDALRRHADVPRPRRGARPRRPGQVAVRRPGHARRRADPRRRRPSTSRSPSPCAPCASHLAALADAVAAALPASPQIVVLDEPWFGELMQPGFPIAPDPAIDLLSGAMAARRAGAPRSACTAARDADIASLLAAGPDVLSVPVAPDAGRRRPATSPGSSTSGGRIAWGVVPTDGPIADVGRAPLARAQRPVVRARRSAAAIPCCCASAASSRRTAGSGCTRRSVADRVCRA